MVTMASENESEKRETLADIVAEMRMGDDGGKPAYRIGRADKVEISMPSGTPVRSYVIECVTIKELADRIEAAVARERGPGNAAAMREALNKVGNAAAWIAESCNDQQTAKYMNDMIAIVQTALSEPARQCDVGTAEEQAERFRAFCNKGKMPQFAESAYCAHECSCRDAADCKFAWAQTPYEAQEGGAK